MFFLFLLPFAVIAVIFSIVNKKGTRHDIFHVFSGTNISDIVDIPTVTPSGAILGPCEIKGKATTLVLPNGAHTAEWVSPIAGKDCVWFDVLVQKLVSSGKSSQWVTEMHYSSGEFSISDEYGSVIIDPRNAETTFNQSVSFDSNREMLERADFYFSQYAHLTASSFNQLWVSSPDGYYKWNPIIYKWISNQDISPDMSMFYDRTQSQWVALPHATDQSAKKFVMPEWMKQLEEATSFLGREDRRVTETIVREGEELFAHGTVTISPSGTDLQMKVDIDKSQGLIVSVDSEQQVIKKRKGTRVYSVLTLFGFFLFVLFNSRSSIDFQSHTFIYSSLGIVAFLLFLALFIKVFGTYNHFVRLRQQVASARSAIDTVLKRRSDLIPSLCDIVIAAAGNFEDVQKHIAELRSNDEVQLAPQFLALSEKYPQIASTQNFLQLQKELARTEEKVAMARSYTNDSILAMNNLRATFFGLPMSPLFPKEQPITF